MSNDHDQELELELERQISESMGTQNAGNKRKAKPSPYLVEGRNELLSLPITSVLLLQKYYKSKRINEREAHASSGTSSAGHGELSTDGILKMAREKLLQCNTQNFEVASILFSDSFDTNSSMSSEKSDDFELALLLQAAALKFSYRKFDRAKRLLNICQSTASPSGNALQRIVTYFATALQERIAKETGGQLVADAQGGRKLAIDVALTTMQPEVMQYHQLLPFCQVTEFTAIQAIVDNVATAKRVHLVDLGIKSGSHWPIMMQALAARHEYPLELLKLTAIGASKDKEIGMMLSSFADSMNIPFEFKLIESDLKDLKEDFFDLSDDEVLAVYSELRLASLLPSPDHLVSLLGTIERLNPCAMVVMEMEASTDSPIFLDRFDGALSICAAIFDCLEDCMDRDEPCRPVIEGVFIGDAIRNVITCEGEERIIRHERLDFWRAFMSRFGFVEIALSDTALCQLNLVVKRNPRWSSCAVEVNGKGLIVGWKGSPIKSLSVWKFQHD